jgi:hypothetical protein
LIVLFDNRSTMTIEPFFDSMGVSLANLSVEVSPGRNLPSGEFTSTFPTTEGQSVLPAAGNAGIPASGANFTSAPVDPMATPDPLALLPPEQPPGLLLRRWPMSE